MKRFGEYIDTYKLLDAVADGTTLQILYEGKTADTALNEKHAFDTKFEDLFSDRIDKELLAIKKKMARPVTFWERRSASRRSPGMWLTIMSTTFCQTDSKPRWCAIPNSQR